MLKNLSLLDEGNIEHHTFLAWMQSWSTCNTSSTEKPHCGHCTSVIICLFKRKSLVFRVFFIASHKKVRIDCGPFHFQMIDHFKFYCRWSGSIMEKKHDIILANTRNIKLDYYAINEFRGVNVGNWRFKKPLNIRIYLNKEYQTRDYPCSCYLVELLF